MTDRDLRDGHWRGEESAGICSIFFAILGAAAIAGVAGVAGAAIDSSGAQSAANTESNAANNATAVQQQQFQQTTANEAPFLQAGTAALGDLTSEYGLGAGGTGVGTANAALDAAYGLGPGGTGVGTANAGFTGALPPFDPSSLQSTPGYQFQYQQGEQALLDAQSATGGVKGGNTLKALTTYGQGEANTEYQQALQNYMQQQTQQFNQENIVGQENETNAVNSVQQNFNNLQTIAGSGQNAASNLGALGAQTATSIGNNITQAGTAQAAATIAGTNAAGSAVSGIGNNLSSDFLLSQLLGNGGLGGLGGAGIANTIAPGSDLVGLY